jgi:hypothetical protein
VLDVDQRRKLLLFLPVVPHLALFVHHGQARALADLAICCGHDGCQLLRASLVAVGVVGVMVARLRSGGLLMLLLLLLLLLSLPLVVLW